MITCLSWFGPALACTLAPMLLSVVNRVKALVAGRNGQPLLQPYRDLARLLQKGAVYSETTSWVLPLATVVVLATALVALLLVPMGAVPAVIAFPGDFIVLAALLALNRVSLVLAALDTGSSLEGMGASRATQLAPLAEPALLLALAAVARLTGHLSLSGMFSQLSTAASWPVAPILFPVTLALVIVCLVENARLPVDDPDTHLELTMIHEGMVLDHSGPDLAIVQYAGTLKLWVLGSLVVGVVLPVTGAVGPVSLLVTVGGLIALAAGIGGLESTMARLRLRHVPRLLMGALVAAFLALVLVFR
ncbi:MAG: NADH-quinone oxidoreductase subunit H [Candidatus Sericytochromatia bacterium]|nr:NADH-quinone oxidoreductase subunit H [Candidatus Sericytochromatia bacterium]